MVEQEENGTTDREGQRLHLNMRPPSPATYQARKISLAGRVFIVIGVVVAVLTLLCLLLLLVYAFIAGDPG